MKINGVELGKSPRAINPESFEGEPYVIIRDRSFSEGKAWPLAEDTIDALCEELRRIVRGAEELTLAGKLFRIRRHGRGMSFNTFGTDNPEWIRDLRDMCNAALGGGEDTRRLVNVKEGIGDIA